MQNWQTLNIKPGTTFWREADKQRVDMESNAKKEGKKKKQQQQSASKYQKQLDDSKPTAKYTRRQLANSIIMKI